MRQYSYLKTIPFSFFSKQLYRDVAFNWKGIGLLYALLLSFILTLIIFIVLAVTFNFLAVAKEEAYYVVDQVPQVTFHKGIASTAEPARFEIKSSKGKILGVINTSGATDEVLPNREGPLFVVLKNKTLYAEENRTQEMGYPGDKDFVLNKDLLHGMVDQGTRPVVVYSISAVLFIFSLIFFFVFRLAVNVIISVFGVIISKILKANLNYETIFRLSFIASTPSIILSVIPGTPAGFWVRLIITIIYLFIAIKSTKLTSTTNGEPHVVT